MPEMLITIAVVGLALLIYILFSRYRRKTLYAKYAVRIGECTSFIEIVELQRKVAEQNFRDLFDLAQHKQSEILDADCKSRLNRALESAAEDKEYNLSAFLQFSSNGLYEEKLARDVLRPFTERRIQNATSLKELRVLKTDHRIDQELNALYELKFDQIILTEAVEATNTNEECFRWSIPRLDPHNLIGLKKQILEHKFRYSLPLKDQILELINEEIKKLLFQIH